MKSSHPSCKLLRSVQLGFTCYPQHVFTFALNCTLRRLSFDKTSTSRGLNTPSPILYGRAVQLYRGIIPEDERLTIKLTLGRETYSPNVYFLFLTSRGWCYKRGRKTCICFGNLITKFLTIHGLSLFVIKKKSYCTHSCFT